MTTLLKARTQIVHTKSKFSQLTGRVLDSGDAEMKSLLEFIEPGELFPADFFTIEELHDLRACDALDEPNEGEIAVWHKINSVSASADTEALLGAD